MHVQAFVEMLGRMRNSFVGGKEFMEALPAVGVEKLPVLGG